MKKHDEFMPDIDLGASFEKLKNEMFINYNGCNLENIGHDRYRWNGHEGTLVEIGTKIREARLAAQMSIERGREALEKRLKQ
jgi:hypothetical protein